MTSQYVMLIDLQLCTGCNTCSVACKQENNLPDGVWWTQVFTVGQEGEDRPTGLFPDLQLTYLPLSCQHCQEAPCLEVCPSGATQRSGNGVVELDPSLCIGCRYCMMVCPYTGVRVYAEEVHHSLPFPTGDNPLVHRARTVEKCTFCAHRLAQGLQPVCVEFCPMEARHFGDLNDEESEVARLLRTRPHFQLLVEQGTQPSVYYLT